MTDRKAYIFVGPKRAGDTTVALQHHEQYVPRGEKILLSDEDHERLKDSFELTPVASRVVVPEPPSVSPAASVARSSIPVKPSSDDESPSAAL